MKPGVVAFLSLMSVGFLQQHLCLENGLPEIKCERHSDEPPKEWTMEHSKTPSDLSNLKAELTLIGGHPRLNISWNLSPDGSIQELTATMICIDSSKERVFFRCNYTKRFESEMFRGKPWFFYYDEYRASLETHYQLTAFNIPTSNIGEDPHEQTSKLQTPGCENNLMRMSTYCNVPNVLWEPNISLCRINNMVEINFTSHEQSSKYDVYLEDTVSHKDINSTVILWSNNSRVTLSFEGVYTDKLQVDIKPRFPECRNDCKTRHKSLDCFIKSWQSTWAFVVLALVVLGLMLGLSIVFGWSFMKRADTRKAPIEIDERMPPVLVLLIYSLDGDPRQKTVVLSFAEFLQDVCSVVVTVDMWQTQKVAQMGPMPWLASCKSVADKVVVLCSAGTGRRQDSVLNMSGAAAEEELFPGAVNMLCHDLRDPLTARKIMVVYLAGVGSAMDVPAVFSPCAKYCLDKDIETFYRDLHDLPASVDGARNTLLQHKRLLYQQRMSRALSAFKACPGPTLSHNPSLFPNPTNASAVGVGFYQFT